MAEDKKISVKLMPDNYGIISSTSVEEKEKYFNDKLLDKLNSKVKLEWAITFEEIGHSIKPIFKAYIYVKDVEDFNKILGEIVYLAEIKLEKGYMIAYSEWNIL